MESGSRATAQGANPHRLAANAHQRVPERLLLSAQLVRASLVWSVSISDWSAPMWVSWVAVVVACVLAY